MIAHSQPQSSCTSANYLHAKFAELLPSIEKHARVAFRGEPLERRQEMMAEVCANCWVAFVGLMERGLEDVIYAGPLAQYAIKQVRSGRKVGTKANVNNISSRHCQVHKGVRIGRLDHYDQEEEAWKEIVVESKKSGPAEVASIKLDFEAWLRILPSRHRRVAKVLATGETTTAAARKFGVSSGRISQIRRELFNAWNRFHGEPEAPAAVA